MDLYFVTRKVYASCCNIIVCGRATSATGQLDEIPSLILVTGKKKGAKLKRERGKSLAGTPRDVEKTGSFAITKKTLGTFTVYSFSDR